MTIIFDNGPIKGCILYADIIRKRGKSKNAGEENKDYIKQLGNPN